MVLPLFAELKRRRVFRALVAWGIVSFAVLQIIEPVMHGLHWPDAVLSYVVVALALGFPVVVALAWAFDVNEGRIERAPSGDLRGLRLGAALLLVGLAAATPGVIYYLVVRKPAPDASVPASVAVLPFVNMSSDKETDYFSDGITEELINALANVEGLHVASRTAVFALKGKALGVQQIGAELKVGTLLEGSIRREGNALRVTAQLIKVSDGYHLWSRSYDRELKSIFAVEDEIARSIAQSLQRTLVGVKTTTIDIEAHDQYLKGLFFANRRTGESLRKAAGFFEGAIKRDPSYALAWDGLADTLALRIQYDDAPPSEMIPKARQAALRALELDPAMGEAHASLGLIADFQSDWPTALAEYRKAIELSPGYAMAWKWLGNALVANGRIDEARVALEKALELEPTSPITNANLGMFLVNARSYPAAEEQLRKALEIDPDSQPTRRYFIYSLSLQGKHEEALAEVDKLHNAPAWLPLSLRALVLARAGRRLEALALSQQAEAGVPRPGLGALLRAATQVALGDLEKALVPLQAACSGTDVPEDLKTSPFLDPLRADPRFHEILRCAKVE